MNDVKLPNKNIITTKDVLDSVGYVMLFDPVYCSFVYISNYEYELSKHRPVNNYSRYVYYSDKPEIINQRVHGISVIPMVEVYIKVENCLMSKGASITRKNRYVKLIEDKNIDI